MGYILSELEKLMTSISDRFLRNFLKVNAKNFPLVLSASVDK